MSGPLFSIITISYNAGEALRRTIESVNAQTYAHVEHVFIDGGSTDGSAALIRHLARREVRGVSEPDRGISDAFNKGTREARGDYLCYLNAGDHFASPEVLERVAQAIASSPDQPPGIFYGDFISISGGVPRVHEASASLEAFAWANPINHQAAFVPRALALAHPYDERLTLGMDYDFWLRVLPLVRFHKLGFPVSVFEMGGRSSAPTWEIHSLLIHRALWHINHGTRMGVKDIAVLAVIAARLKTNALVRRVLGQRLSLAVRARKSRWVERARPLSPNTA